MNQERQSGISSCLDEEVVILIWRPLRSGQDPMSKDQMESSGFQLRAMSAQAAEAGVFMVRS